MDGYIVFVTQYGPWTFDAVLEHGYKASVGLPSYPTESGVRINDHRIVQPIELKVTGVVSSVSFGAIGSLFNNISSIAYVKPATALQFLINMINNSKPFSVITRNSFYSNLVIESFNFTSSPEDENALIFELHLKEFIQLKKLTSKDKPKAEDLKDGDKAKPSIIDKVKSGVVSTVENVTKSVTDAANKVLDVIPSTVKDVAGKVKDFIL